MRLVAGRDLQRRGLDLDEALLVEIVAERARRSPLRASRKGRRSAWRERSQKGGGGSIPGGRGLTIRLAVSGKVGYVRAGPAHSLISRLVPIFAERAPRLKPIVEDRSL